MGRERERKGVLLPPQQQQWQAKGARSGRSSKRDECFEGITMKDPLTRTKVVVRRLPPSLSRDAFVAQIETNFSGTYSWLSFRPGKSTARKQVHSRAYIGFKAPEIVYDFYAGFDGHVFVNEKGSQYKASVEYAPYQRVPEQPKRDLREGTIYDDPEYLEFLEALAKPVEYLPSAEIQLERKEAERQMAGSSKGPIITPLMEFVLQARGQARSLKAAKAAQRSNAKSFRSGIMGPPPMLQKRDKGKPSGEQNPKGRKRNDFKEKKSLDEGNSSNGALHRETEEDKDGLKSDHSRRKLLQREKDKGEASPGYGPRSRQTVCGQQSPSFSYRERSLRKETEPLTERRIPKSPVLRTPGDGEAGVAEDKANGHDARRLRNKDRPDRPVWTPRRRSDPVQTTESGEADVAESQGNKDSRRHARANVPDAYEPENDLDGRNGAFENGGYKGRKDRGSKDGEDFMGKHGKQRNATVFGNNEKQVWVAVQKPGSGP